MDGAQIIICAVCAAWWLSLAGLLARRRWLERCRNLALDAARGGEHVPPRLMDALEGRGPPLAAWAWALLDAAEIVASLGWLPAWAVWAVIRAACLGTLRASVVALALAAVAAGNLAWMLRRARRNRRAAADAAQQVFGAAYEAADEAARDRMEQIALRDLRGVGQDGLRRD